MGHCLPASTSVTLVLSFERFPEMLCTKTMTSQCVTILEVQLSRRQLACRREGDRERRGERSRSTKAAWLARASSWRWP